MAKVYQSKSQEQRKQEKEELFFKVHSQIMNYTHDKEELEKALDFMSTFYQYSLNNSMLIANQFSNAVAVGSYQKWKERGFHVTKGEKGIKILVPYQTAAKFIDEEKKIQLLKKATPKQLEKMKNNELKEIPSRTDFKGGYVFDISQTNATAEDIPKLFPNRWLEGNIKEYFIFEKGMNEIARELGFKIVAPYEELGNAKGVCYLDTKEIALNPRNSELQNIKTLIHELAHAELHSADDRYSDSEREFQAEMVAYVTCKHFGMDTDDYSLGYIHNWTAGTDVKERQELLSEVKDTSRKFIEKVESVYEQEKGVEKSEGKECETKEGYWHIKCGIQEMNITSITETEMNAIVGKESSIRMYNQMNHEEIIVKQNDVKEPMVLFGWSEHKDIMNNSLMSFEQANKLVHDINRIAVFEPGYYKTELSVLLPSKDGQIKVFDISRMYIGDRKTTNVLEHIKKENGKIEKDVVSILEKAVDKGISNERGMENER